MTRIFTFFLILSGYLFLYSELSNAKTYLFRQDGFPSLENGTVSQAALNRALSGLDPIFIDINYLRDSTLESGSLLIFPYGSSVPEDAWENISRFLNKGNLLIIGGSPFNIPVKKKGDAWVSGIPQNSFSKALGLQHKNIVPLKEDMTLQWDEDSPFFDVEEIKAKRAFVNAGYGDRYRGLAYFLNEDGDRIAAPVSAEDNFWFNDPPVRRVYLSFEADSVYWESEDGINLIRQSAEYAALGGMNLWLDIQALTVEQGGTIAGAVDVVSGIDSAEVTIQLLQDDKVINSRKTLCRKKLHEEIGINTQLSATGLYKLRVFLSKDGKIVEQYTSGVFVRDLKLLHSGKTLSAGRDYFRLDGKPYLPVGVNYFSTDKNTSGFFVGGSLGGNAAMWDRDFAEMKRLGLTIVRTGIWLNRFRYLDPVSGAADERLLRNIEAFLQAAARNDMQVIFTFFAFEPQSENQPRGKQQANLLGPGANPYIDERAFRAQSAYVSAIASRFKNVPFLSFDLVNEPSFNNPERLWKGNSPNFDPVELAAWQNWLQKKYITIDSLAGAWLIPSQELKSFNNVSVPAFEDLELTRFGSQKTIRAIDWNLFAQDEFTAWANKMIGTIREAGAKQIVTVGHDEGGVTGRVLNHFWAQGSVAYTSNHTWWRDDAMLWNSAAAKTPIKPNLIGETGLQPAWSMAGSWRHDEITGFPLLERKLVLGFSNANAGVLYWDWTQTDPFGILRRDGSYKKWIETLKGVALFAKEAHSYAVEAKMPTTAIVMPQSLQLSTFNNWGIEIQQKAVRALYHYARSTAFTIGEYQLHNMPEDVKLIIVPSPWIFSDSSWNQLLAEVNEGKTMLISGRIDADEHWMADTTRLAGLNITYSSAPLLSREALITWPGDSAYITYSSDKTLYGERGVLQENKTFIEVAFGKGKILYSALPIELADQFDVIGKIYRYAGKQAGVEPVYETTVTDPGILISPTRVADGTIYVLTSESSNTVPVSFKDNLSRKTFNITLQPGRGALMLIDKSGKVVSSYNITD